MKFKIGDRVRWTRMDGIEYVGSIRETIGRYHVVDWDEGRGAGFGHELWRIPDDELGFAEPQRKFSLGDRVVLNRGEPNEKHGTVETAYETYGVRWDGPFYADSHNPSGPYGPRELHEECAPLGAAYWRQSKDKTDE